MIRFGNICDRDADACRVRVEFDDDGVVSHWLPVLVASSMGDKFFHLPDINSHVVCLMDARNENGVVLGAIYDSNNPPGVGGDDVTAVKFSDNTSVAYDRASHILTATVGTTTFKASQTGFEISRGGESIKTLLNDLLTEITLLTVTCASPGSPSTPPVNLANFTAIIARLSNLFTA